MTEYAELHCHSFYSLLDRAAELGIKHLALTDRDGLCRSPCPNPGHLLAVVMIAPG